MYSTITVTVMAANPTINIIIDIVGTVQLLSRV